MAHGRMLNQWIRCDKEVNDLPALSALTFTWAIPHLDRDGRMYGDPDLFKSTVVPRRRDISVEMIEGFLTDWSQRGLVVWYEVHDEKYLFFPGFRKNQPNLRYGRETPSRIPPPEEGKIIENVGPAEHRQSTGYAPVKSQQNTGETPELLRGERRRRMNTWGKGIMRRLPGTAKQP